MIEEEPFLQAILEQPDDDTNRLAFADWLLERGDLRGEYLRAHVQAVAAIRRLTELQTSVDQAWALTTASGLVALLLRAEKKRWFEVRIGMVLITPDGRTAEVLEREYLTHESWRCRVRVQLRDRATGATSSERYLADDPVEVLQLVVGDEFCQSGRGPKK